MKPLTDSDNLLKRFNHFKDGELRSVEVISPTSIRVTLAGQDEAREYDWKSIQLEFSEILDAQLLENSKYHLIDMTDGISILKINDSLAFGIGECYNVSNIKASHSYIMAKYIKYEEASF